ncbi:ATP-binding protein [Piscinibacter sp.]|uniref:ATP-binding protein n=1 Tax=Piscinibacter sp. TaxID=1903157 RepID=UPI002CD4726C|nr:ATP-binding protein [Albitalea sp.]HUG23425.1 ATP-binding protein [Albitalea sp.]
MKFGIKQKILLVLVGVLALSTALNALLASFFTNRQNEEAAFASLRSDLQAWQSDLQAMTQQLKGVALATVGDAAILNQLGELMSLEFNLADPARAAERREMARTLGYRKTVALNRLQLALRTGGFTSIAVYTRGQLSHVISAVDAGMSVRREDGRQAWTTATANAKGDIPFQSWPAWSEAPVPVADDRLHAAPEQPGVSFVFPRPGEAVLEIAVPVQGYVDDVLTDALRAPVVRFFSELSVAGEPGPPNATTAKSAARPPGRTPRIVAVVVFRKLIGRAMLENVTQKTGKSPVLLSPDGHHRQQLDDQPVIPPEMLQQAQATLLPQASAPLQRSVTVGEKSFYVALLPWQFENQPRLMLALATPRDSTLRNIQQTVVAILLAAGATLLLSVAVGLWWVKRFMDPIVNLTAAVKGITSRNRLDVGPQQQVLERLQPVVIEAPDEVGALARAFNDMIGELQHSFETLEQRVQARTAELRQQARYLRTLIDMLPMWAWFKDTDGRFLAVNQAAAGTRGLSPDELVGKSDHDVSPREQADAYRADDMEVMTSRRQKTLEEAHRLPGGTIWLETFKAPVLDEDGTVLGTVGVARDISERKATEAAREVALAEAQRLARMRSEFLAQMSHELRTPLNAILGFAQILQRDESLDERQTRALQIIEESGRHLLSLIEDVLDMARIDAAKVVLDPTEVDLSVFLRAVCDIVRVKAEEKSLLFNYRTAGRLPAAVRADEKRLRQVLLNLLSNAIKFTDSGEVTLRVHALAASPQPGRDAEGTETMVRLRFEVQDSGIGMGEAQLARLFQPFEQVADTPRREGGTGLGLAISRQLVRLMGGDVQVHSQPGKGSVFSFELELPTAQPQAPIAPGSGTPIGYEGPRRRVLVIDDVPHNRAMLFDALSSLGIEVLEAGDGKEGLEVAGRTRPDLIMLDAMMPVMDGFEATRRLRQLPALADVPIIATSASPTRDVEARFRTAGADAFISKPIDQNALLEALGKLMGLLWIYEEPEPRTAERAGSGDDDRSLVYPPPEEMQVLRDLARIGNMRSIRERAEYLQRLDARYASFGARLAALAEACQSRAITALVEGANRSPTT